MNAFSTIFLIILLSCSLLCCMSCVVFGSSESWVEVARFTGAHTNQQTSSFECDCPEWRIKWEFNDTHEAYHFPDLLRFSITVFAHEYPQSDYNPPGHESNYVINQIEAADFGKRGTKIIENQVGDFHLVIEASYVVDGYTVVIEQNVDSIPEFSSWLVLPFFLLCSLSVLVIKKKLFNNHQENKIKLQKV